MLDSYVDASKEPFYVLAAAVVHPRRFEIRDCIRTLLMPRQWRTRFANESHHRRTKIMACICDLPIEAVIYMAADKGKDNAAQDRCMTALIRDQLARNVGYLTINMDETRVPTERKILYREVKAAGVAGRFSYDHHYKPMDPMFAIPDAIAWCWRRGGRWRAMAESVVTNICEA